MTYPRRTKLITALLAVGALLSTGNAWSAPLSPADAEQAALDAYVYGYPLVTMEMTRRIITNVEKPEGSRGPMGNLIKLRRYPDASCRDVTAPNADTLYPPAFLDVGKEPWILSLPDAQDRYFLFPMLDGWTDVFQVPGKRTTGTAAQTYAITGPNWKGTLPKGVVEYKSPTSMVWILGRIYCTGTDEDYKAVHAMQDAIGLVPLSAFGKPFTPPAGKVDPSIDMKTPVRDQVNGMSAADYFTLLAKLMKDNPPAAADAPILAQMAKLGIAPGKPFVLPTDKAVADAVSAAPKKAFEKIMGHLMEAGTFQNGWIFTTNAGTYGTDYLQRALITAIGLGANRPQDAVYPTSEKSAAGQPYDGKKSYVMHFPKGQLPPANAFWSLTMYNDQYFFVDNPLNRYNVSSRSAFKQNTDGSVDVYIQNQNPGPEKESNWLPAPAAGFILMLRMYWPQETPPSIIDGTWKIPAVVEAK